MPKLIVVVRLKADDDDGIKRPRNWRTAWNKYQLSLIDPRDCRSIVLSIELDDHCDKLAVDSRSSEALST